MAARGACNLDAGEEQIRDESVAALLRKKARSLHGRALLAGLLATLLLLALLP